MFAKRKQVGTILDEYYEDDEWYSAWVPIYEPTVWGRICILTNKVLYKLHLKKRKSLDQILKEVYYPKIVEQLYETPVILHRLMERENDNE